MMTRQITNHFCLLMHVQGPSVGKHSDNVSVWILRVASLRIVYNSRFSTNYDHPFSTGGHKWNINIGEDLRNISF